MVGGLLEGEEQGGRGSLKTWQGDPIACGDVVISSTHDIPSLRFRLGTRRSFGAGRISMARTSTNPFRAHGI
jgi:hypothetical protein